MATEVTACKSKFKLGDAVQIIVLPYVGIVGTITGILPLGDEYDYVVESTEYVWCRKQFGTMAFREDELRFLTPVDTLPARRKVVI